MYTVSFRAEDFNPYKEELLFKAGADLITHTAWGSPVNTLSTLWDRDYTFNGTIEDLEKQGLRVDKGQYNQLFV